METMFFGDTKTRYAYIGKHNKDSTYYVSLTDWTTRQGGSYQDCSLDQAIGIAQDFVNGAPYRFDQRVGLTLI
jgi:hypothetical protein